MRESGMLLAEYENAVLEMGKKLQTNSVRVVNDSGSSLKESFYKQVRSVLERAQAYRSVNFIMVEAYWNVGRLIVEEEQRGRRRAIYGDYIVKSLAKHLTCEFGKGFTQTNLWYMRQFYLAFPAGRSPADRYSRKGHAAHDQSQILHALRGGSQIRNALRSQQAFAQGRKGGCPQILYGRVGCQQLEHPPAGTPDQLVLLRANPLPCHRCTPSATILICSSRNLSISSFFGNSSLHLETKSLLSMPASAYSTSEIVDFPLLNNPNVEISDFRMWG